MVLMLDRVLGIVQEKIATIESAASMGDLTKRRHSGQEEDE